MQQIFFQIWKKRKCPCFTEGMGLFQVSFLVYHVKSKEICHIFAFQLCAFFNHTLD